MSTQQAASVPFILIPTLHRELAPDGLPQNVLAVWPGLPETQGCLEGYWRPDLPYTPAQAAACLTAFSELDEDSLHQVGGEFKSASQQKRVDKHQENRDLALFAKTGSVPSRDVLGVDSAEARRWAQRFLLLGWLQEQRALEMTSLVARYRAGANKLAVQLSDGAESELFSELCTTMHDLLPENPAELLPSWRFMLDLLAVLLPADRPLFTADERMVCALAQAGLCQEPLSEALRTQLALDEASARFFTYGNLPLWQVLGKEPDKPWHDTPRLLVVCHSNLESAHD